MPRYYPNNRFSDCYSSVGNITFYHRNGACYYKTKPKPQYPGTPKQTTQLNLHRRAIQAWRNLPHQTQLQWNTLAKTVKSKRPPHNTNAHISGYNLFISAYHGLAATSQETTPTPQPIPIFPTITLKHIQTTITNDAHLEITYQTNSPLATFTNYTLIGKLQLTPPGQKPNTGNYRNYTPSITTNQTHTHIKFTIPIPNNQQIDPTQCNIHLKYLLIHTKTGYRTPEEYHTTITTHKS